MGRNENQPRDYNIGQDKDYDVGKGNEKKPPSRRDMLIATGASVISVGAVTWMAPSFIKVLEIFGDEVKRENFGAVQPDIVNTFVTSFGESTLNEFSNPDKGVKKGYDLHQKNVFLGIGRHLPAGSPITDSAVVIGLPASDVEEIKNLHIKNIVNKQEEVAKLAQKVNYVSVSNIYPNKRELHYVLTQSEGDWRAKLKDNTGILPINITETTNPRDKKIHKPFTIQHLMDVHDEAFLIFSKPAKK
jgi:hypothetical protein